MSENSSFAADDRRTQRTLTFQWGQWGQVNLHRFQCVTESATRDSSGATQWGQRQLLSCAENYTGGASPLCVPIVPSAVPSGVIFSGDSQSPASQRLLSPFIGVPTVPIEKQAQEILQKQKGA
jgi:hypothetical protein